MITYNQFMKRICVVVAIIIALGAVVGLNLTEEHKINRTNSVLAAHYFETFSIKGLDGEEFSADDLKGHKVTVINGWAPWCGPCTSEMPEFEELSKEYESKGLQIIGIVADYAVTDDKESYDKDIRNAIKSSGITYPVFVSDDEFIDHAAIMMNNAFPGTWAIDENGEIIDFVMGARSKEVWASYFDKWLEGR